MAKSSVIIQQFARVGALARLAEVRAEILEIERAFPGIGNESSGGRRPGRPRAVSAAIEAAPTPRTRRPMTAEQKKAVGARMKKYWAARRKAQAK